MQHISNNKKHIQETDTFTIVHTIDSNIPKMYNYKHEHRSV